MSCFSWHCGFVPHPLHPPFKLVIDDSVAMTPFYLLLGKHRQQENGDALSSLSAERTPLPQGSVAVKEVGSSALHGSCALCVVYNLVRQHVNVCLVILNVEVKNEIHLSELGLCIFLHFCLTSKIFRFFFFVNFDVSLLCIKPCSLFFPDSFWRPRPTSCPLPLSSAQCLCSLCSSLLQKPGQ